MIETIKYYYDISINNYKVVNNNYFFGCKQDFFGFVLCEYDESEISDINKIITLLKYNGINYHDIILNKFGRFFSVYNDKKYLLFKLNKKFSEEILIWDMLKINTKSQIIEIKRDKFNNDWKKLWENKVNYFEMQIKELAKEKENVLNTFSYYIGLSECAIQYITLVEEKYHLTEYDIITFCHRRIYSPNYGLNYYNPLLLVLDLDVRDYAEYFKSSFFKGIDIKEEFKSFLRTKRFSDYSYNMLYARLLFPTYYFDTYEKMLQNDIDQEKVIEILKYTNAYELFLKFAYNEIAKYSPLIKINWIYDN